MSEEFDDARDCHDSYYGAIAEIGRRVKAGEEPIPTTGYFGPRERGRIVQEVKYVIPKFFIYTILAISLLLTFGESAFAYGRGLGRVVSTAVVTTPSFLPSTSSGAPFWAILLLIFAGCLLAFNILRWLGFNPLKRGVEFFQDRDALVARDQSLGRAFRDVSEVWALWVVGQKFYDPKEQLDKMKKLLLPDPNGAGFPYFLQTTAHENVPQLIRRVSRDAKQSGAEVRWYGTFLFHSIVLADTKKSSGWIHLESVLPYSTSGKRPSYRIYKRGNREAVQEMRRVYEEIWKSAREPTEAELNASIP